MDVLKYSTTSLLNYNTKSSYVDLSFGNSFDVIPNVMYYTVCVDYKNMAFIT